MGAKISRVSDGMKVFNASLFNQHVYYWSIRLLFNSLVTLKLETKLNHFLLLY